MAVFPTLSRDVEWTITEDYEDSTIRSTTEAGYEHTRARYTYDRKIWSISYKYLVTADRTALRAFLVTVRVGVDSFTWTNPDDSTAYTVRFKEPPKLERMAPGYYALSCSFKQL